MGIRLRNNYRVEGDFAYIELSSAKYGKMETKISLSDLDKAISMPYTWYPKHAAKTDNFYVAANIYVSKKTRTTIKLHRFLLSPDDSYLDVDHINHNTLDNSRENLRVTTPSQNQMNRNRSNKNNRTGVIGVSYRKDSQKYRVRVYRDRKLVFNEEFAELEDAEQASISARREIYGNYFNIEYKK